MRILKHGAPRIGVFECDHCGCVWQALPSESIDECRESLKWGEYIISMDCPECGLRAFGKKADCDILCYSCKHWTGETPYIGNQERFCDFIDPLDEKAPDFVTMRRPPERME